MCLIVALFSCPHQQQHIRQSIHHIEQLPAGGVELIGCRSLFRSGSAGGDARKFNVIRLEFWCATKVDFELVETVANVLNSRSHLRFALCGLVCRRGSTFASSVLNCGNAARHSAKDVHELGQILDLVGYAGRALGSHLCDSLGGRSRRGFLPAGPAARLGERRRGSQKNQC